MNEDNWPGRLVSSATNKSIKEDSRLRNRRQRDRSGMMCAEGHDEIQLALSAGIQPVRLYYCPELFREDETTLFNQLSDDSGTDIIRVNRSIMSRLSYREHPDGWFAVLTQPDWGLSRLPEPRENELFLVAESIEKPGNVGAILRSAEACGAAGMILCGNGTDISNPNVVRASKGVSLFYPVAQCSNSQAWKWLVERRISCVLADPGQSSSIWEKDLKGRIALVLGSEHLGIGDFWRGKDHSAVSIPMSGRINSLNVAQAAGIIMFEIMRRQLS